MMSHNVPIPAYPEARSNGTDPVRQPISLGQIKSAEVSKMMEGTLTTSVPALKRDRSVSARIVQAHVDRRKRLAEQIRAQCPHYTEAEVEERMEQFGA
jgi:hypothetical protein